MPKPVLPDVWMKDMGLLDIEERLGSVRDLVVHKGRHVEFSERDETIAQVASRMSELGISQMPIRPDGSGSLLMVHEIDLLRALASGACKGDDKVLNAAAPLTGVVSIDDSLTKVQRVFDQDEVAVVMEDGEMSAIIAKIDVVEFLAERS